MTLDDLLRAVVADAVAPLRAEIAELRREIAETRRPAAQERLLRVSEAADRAGVAVRTMRAWISGGRIESVLVNGCRRVPEHVIERLASPAADSSVEALVDRSLATNRRRRR